MLFRSVSQSRYLRLKNTKMSKKLWQKNNIYENEHAALVEKFTIGRDAEFDLQLAKYDVLGNKAHVKMLATIGLIEESELPKILDELDQIATQIEEGKFVIEEGIEDVHSQIEFQLTQKLGDIGKKIHSARSRNDQVLVDIKLFLKNEILEIKDLVKNLFQTLQKLSNEHQNKLIPVTILNFKLRCLPLLDCGLERMQKL